MWYIYLIRCKDTSLYTGITTDPKRRYTAHRKGNVGSKYVRAKGIQTMYLITKYETQGDALREEFRIKKLSHQKKEGIIRHQGVALEFEN